MAEGETISAQQPSPPQRIFVIHFNQDHECFVCGCSDGFRTYNAFPLKQVQFQPMGGPVIAVEMLYRCNYLALIGGGYPLNNVVIWDCSLQRAVTVVELDSFVISVRLTRERIIAVQHEKLQVFGFSDIPRRLYTLETGSNPDGLCAISDTGEFARIAHPSKPQNKNNEGDQKSAAITVASLASPKRAPVTFRAHNNKISAFVFDSTSKMLATASVKGTVVRVFDTSNGQLLREFRRGSNSAKIYCINFSADASLICVSSNHSTVHVFQLYKPSRNLRRLEKYLKGGINVSFSRLHVGKTIKTCKENANAKDTDFAKGIVACAFNKNSDSVIALGMNGSYHNMRFDARTGRCSQQAFQLLFELDVGRRTSLESTSYPM